MKSIKINTDELVQHELRVLTNDVILSLKNYITSNIHGSAKEENFSYENIVIKFDVDYYHPTSTYTVYINQVLI